MEDTYVSFPTWAKMNGFSPSSIYSMAKMGMLPEGVWRRRKVAKDVYEIKRNFKRANSKQITNQ